MGGNSSAGWIRRQDVALVRRCFGQQSAGVSRPDGSAGLCGLEDATLPFVHGVLLGITGLKMTGRILQLLLPGELQNE